MNLWKLSKSVKVFFPLQYRLTYTKLMLKRIPKVQLDSLSLIKFSAHLMFLNSFWICLFAVDCIFC